MNIRKNQSGQLLAAQREYPTTLTAQVFERFSAEVLDFSNDNSKNPLDSIIDFQKIILA